MDEPERPAIRITVRETWVRAEAHVPRAALAAAAGISESTLARLERAGLIEASAPAEFSAAQAARLRRMLRLHRDLAVGLEAAAIIVDLLDRLERAEETRGG